MRRLMLLRHAKAVPQGETADEDRPLAERGRRDTAAAAKFLADNALVPEIALISPSKRTRETWDLVAAVFPKAPPHRFEPQLYAASADTLARLVREMPSRTQSLLLIGHNPGMEEFARSLVGSGDTEALMRFGGKLPTASLAVLDLPLDDWRRLAEKTARLKIFVTPKSLGARD
jgi:phosphohistidine phosphatase